MGRVCCIIKKACSTVTTWCSLLCFKKYVCSCTLVDLTSIPPALCSLLSSLIQYLIPTLVSLLSRIHSPFALLLLAPLFAARKLSRSLYRVWLSVDTPPLPESLRQNVNMERVVGETSCFISNLNSHFFYIVLVLYQLMMRQHYVCLTHPVL